MVFQDKNELKFSLDIADVADFVAEMGGEPQMKVDYFVAKTICHCGSSMKLYYYNNTHLFKCYSGCAEDNFDIYQLVMKVKQLDLHDAINYTCHYFNLALVTENNDVKESLPDWEYFKKKKNKSAIKATNNELLSYEDNILNHYPRIRVASWEAEGITKEQTYLHNIRYDPVNQGIIIPHYDASNRLVGIRERTLIKDEECYGKYRPAILGGQMFNHPLGFNLYNLNKSKENIGKYHTAIVGEGEKFCLSFASFCGDDDDISVACCGSNLTKYQFDLLRRAGAHEIIIAFDRQFEEHKGEEYQLWMKKLISISEKYKRFVRITYLFDVDDLLGYKESPTDKGKDILQIMMDNRRAI